MRKTCLFRVYIYLHIFRDIKINFGIFHLNYFSFGIIVIFLFTSEEDGNERTHAKIITFSLSFFLLAFTLSYDQTLFMSKVIIWPFFGRTDQRRWWWDGSIRMSNRFATPHRILPCGRVYGFFRTLVLHCKQLIYFSQGFLYFSLFVFGSKRIFNLGQKKSQSKSFVWVEYPVFWIFRGRLLPIHSLSMVVLIIERMRVWLRWLTLLTALLPYYPL